MKTIILLSLLVITGNQAYGGEWACSSATLSCATSRPVISILEITCDGMLPYFKCLRYEGCGRDDSVYKAQVELFSYEKCEYKAKVTTKGPKNSENKPKLTTKGPKNSGESAIIMGWTLPILMFTVAKYFSNR